jgi:hypothetical protein
MSARRLTSVCTAKALPGRSVLRRSASAMPASIEVGDEDLRAGLVQALDDAASDAHRSAGDDRGLAAEVDELGDGRLGESGWRAQGTYAAR